MIMVVILVIVVVMVVVVILVMVVIPVVIEFLTGAGVISQSEHSRHAGQKERCGHVGPVAGLAKASQLPTQPVVTDARRLQLRGQAGTIEMGIVGGSGMPAHIDDIGYGMAFQAIPEFLDGPGRMAQSEKMASCRAFGSHGWFAGRLTAFMGLGIGLSDVGSPGPQSGIAILRILP